MNLALEYENMRIYLVKWEYLDATMSPIHKQEEYNKTLEQCDLCFVLFATRFGKYTESELKTAYEKLCQGGKDSGKLTVFFKDAGTETDELKDFKHSFKDNYPGIQTKEFDSAAPLKKDFLIVWNEYQKENLVNKYPVTFMDNKAILSNEILLTI